MEKKLRLKFAASLDEGVGGEKTKKHQEKTVGGGKWPLAGLGEVGNPTNGHVS